jgi:hypothetical protein
MKANYYPVIRSIASYFLPKNIFKKPGSGGTFSSEYCYSVWLRHLNYLIDRKLIDNVDSIKKVAEIGPGDSLGIGISALYTGASNYYGFDVIKHANLKGNITINKEILKYFQEKNEIPHGKKLINTAPVLMDYSFPIKILKHQPEYYLRKYEEIDSALKGEKNKTLNIEYVVPWTNVKQGTVSNIDLIYSQAVMEHVEDIDFVYGEMYKWLKNGGVISHQIDFKAHEMTREWNGHWFISESFWKFLLHGRKYSINRLPLSAHIKAIENAGFTIKTILPVQRPNSFNGQMPKVKGVNYTQEDLITSGALIQAVKPHE